MDVESRDRRALGTPFDLMDFMMEIVLEDLKAVVCLLYRLLYISSTASCIVPNWP